MTNNNAAKVTNVPHTFACPATTMLCTQYDSVLNREVWECDDNGGCGAVEVLFVGSEYGYE